MTVITMEPIVIRGRRPDRAGAAGPVDAEPAAGRVPVLTNRAAGALRAAASPERVAFGGFGYLRTEEDAAQVTSYARAAARRAAAPPVRVAGPVVGPDVERVVFGGAAYQRTAEDDDQVAGYAPADARGAVVAAVPAGASGEPSAEGPLGDTAAETEPDDSAGASTGSPTTASAGAALVPGGGSPPAVPVGIDTTAALVSAARVAADALPRPEITRPDLAAAMSPLVAAAGARARRPLPRGGGGSYPAPRPVEPIEIDPVPEATATLSTALNNRLPELALPAILAMPDRTVPTLPTVRGVDAEELAVQVNVADPAADADAVNSREASRRRDAARPGPDAVVPAPAPVPVSPPVLVDFRPRPPDPLPPASAELETQQITRVLALISQNVDQRAQQLIDQVRDQAFPPHKLANYYLDVTNPLLDQTKKALSAKVEELRVAAGITAEVLRSAVATRQAELNAGVAHVATAAELEATETAVTLTREAELENARAEARRLRDQARQVARYRQALHSRDPTLVEELVTARLGYIDTDVATGMTSIDAAKSRRLDLIGLYDTAYRTAYRTADDTWQHPAGRGPRAPPNTADGHLWYDVALDGLATSMRNLRNQTENDGATLLNGVRDAGLAAKAAVRTWSDTRLRRTLTADQATARTTGDIDTTNTAVSAARAQAARDATRGRLVNEIRFATATALRTMDDAEAVSRSHLINLTDEQLRAGRQFLAAGDPDDPLSAVANNLIQNYARDNLLEEPARVRTAIYAKEAATPAEAGELGDIYFPGGGGELEGRVNRLWTAFEVWHGTAEEDAIAALGSLDTHSTTLLNRAYFLIKNEDLQWRIGDELSGSDKDQALGLASDDLAMHARGVIADADGWFSNDPARALDAIRNLPPGQAAGVVADPDTRAHLTEVLGGTRWVDSRGSVNDDRGERELQLLVQLNRPLEADDPVEAARRRDLQARADAIEFDRAVRRGTGGEASSEAVTDRIRASVVASAPDTWSADEIDNEVRRRMRAMENAYETEFGSELPTSGVSALRTAVARYSYGTTLDLRQALLDVDRAGERASRLQRTTQGLYTSDSELNTELTRTYNDALAEVRRNRDRRDAVEARARALMDADGVTAGGRTPSPDELAAYRQEAEEEAARTLAGTWMGEVGTSFASRYGRRWGGGADPLRAMITSETQFGGETEALARLGNGGGLTAAQSVQIGQAGWGMDRNLVLAGIGNRSRQQLTRIGADYTTITDGGDMLADLRSETGSWTDATPDTRLERDAFDIREAMRGVPTTPRESYEAARRRFEYERDVYFGGATGRPTAVSAEFASLQRQMDRVNARMRDLEAANASGDTAAARRIEYGLSSARASVGVAADAYRHAVDEHVEGVAQKVAIAVAIAVVVIAAAVTTFFTGGLAAPAWVAVLTAVGASVAATGASMAVKASMLSAAYGQNAIRTDLAVGAVDAIIAALTAGLGDKLLRLRALGQLAGARTAAARTLASRALAAERAARPLWQRMAAFSAEQAAQAVPTALTGAALNRETWKGDPLRNFASAATLAAGAAIGLGAVMHHTMPHVTGAVSGLVEAGRLRLSGSGAHITPDSVTLASARNAAAAGNVEGANNRGSWAERNAARAEYLRANPDRTSADFEIALLMGSIDTSARAQAVADTLPELRAHLVSGLSAAEAELARHARIEVLSDADFFARTGSEANGYAATLNVRGEPVVVVREGAPLSRLAEEGRHVAQFFDPANASRLALIEEGRVALHAGLPIPDQIASWQAKIDLELDVAGRQIPELRAQLADPDLPPSRVRDLATMLAEAEAAVEVLSGRRATLNALGPADVARMVAGDLPPPHFLADEPRLFAKAKQPPTLTAESFTRGSLTFEAEAAFKAGGRWSRYVFVSEGGVLREVVLQRWRNGNWALSGRVGRERGGVAEVAARIEHALSNAAEETATVTLRQYNGQIGTGAGLDDVWFRFETLPGGAIEARARLYEAKNYDDSQVSSYTAIDENFKTNVDRVRDRLREHLRDGSWDEAGMTRAQVEAAIRSLETRQVDVIIRTTPSTRVDPADLSRLQGKLNRGRAGRPVRVVHAPTPISEAAMLEAEELWFRMEQLRQRGAKDPDNMLFKELSNGPRGITPESIDVADAVVAARGRPGSPITGRVEWGPGRDHLTDSTGPFKAMLIAPPPPGAAFDADAQARALLAAVEAGVPGVSGGTPRVRVVVAYDQWLMTSQARQLRQALAAIAASEGRTSAAAEIIWPDVRGTAP